MDLNVAFLLNPFVSKEPILAWGLPLRQLEPMALFRHAEELLKTRQGLLVLSNPSEEEQETSLYMANRAGFSVHSQTLWQANPDGIQKRPRYGTVLRAL